MWACESFYSFLASGLLARTQANLLHISVCHVNYSYCFAKTKHCSVGVSSSGAWSWVNNGWGIKNCFWVCLFSCWSTCSTFQRAAVQRDDVLGGMILWGYCWLCWGSGSCKASFEGRRKAADNFLSGWNDPLERLPVCWGAAGKPRRDVIVRSALNATEVAAPPKHSQSSCASCRSRRVAAGPLSTRSLLTWGGSASGFSSRDELFRHWSDHRTLFEHHLVSLWTSSVYTASCALEINTPPLSCHLWTWW